MKTKAKMKILMAVSALLAGQLLVSCNGDKNLKKGEQYWAIGEYYEAAQEFAKAYAKTPPSMKEKRGKIAYKVQRAIAEWTIMPRRRQDIAML